MKMMTVEKEEVSFSNISINTFGSLEIRYGKTHKTRMTIPKKYEPYITKKVKDQTLYISHDESHGKKPANQEPEVKIIVYTPSLDSVYAHTTGMVTISSTFESKKVAVEAHSVGVLGVSEHQEKLRVKTRSVGVLQLIGTSKSGEVVLDVKSVGQVLYDMPTRKLKMKVKSTGIVNISSTINIAKIRLSALGGFNARSARINDLDIVADKVNGLSMHVEKELALSASLSNNIEVYGKAKITKKQLDKFTHLEINR